MIAARFTLERSTKIATAGSCFAQHISKAVQEAEFCYFVAEQGKNIPLDEREKRQYGVFSARYGNIYSAAQLIQLVDRAYGRFEPRDVAWPRGDGRYVDPFRPEIEPDGFLHQDDVVRDRDEHLRSVRNMFETLDVFVFTLGLTECWRSTHDGAVFPIAPGVRAGEANPHDYEFHNQTIDEIRYDMRRFVEALSVINPKARIILTVSPVPLAATFTKQHVLPATHYSKAVLRVVADELSYSFANVEYFPSFEIITGSFNRGSYFEDDLRSVNAKGVAHVMRCFFQHFVKSDNVGTETQLAGIFSSSRHDVRGAEAIEAQKVICEEGFLDET